VSAAVPPVRMPPRTELTRKALHLSTAIVPIAWGLGWASVTTVRNGTLLLAGVAMLAEAARAALPPVRAAIGRLVGALFRPHEWRGVLGATWLALAMGLAALLLPSRAAIVAIWAAAVGDAAAALIGRTFARREGKSSIGSLACLAATAAGAMWLASATPAAALAIGAAAAVAERPRLPLDDNLRVAAAAGLAAWVLGVA
jgi:dolichol kinase